MDSQEREARFVRTVSQDVCVKKTRQTVKQTAWLTGHHSILEGDSLKFWFLHPWENFPSTTSCALICEDHPPTCELPRTHNHPICLSCWASVDNCSVLPSQPAEETEMVLERGLLSLNGEISLQGSMTTQLGRGLSCPDHVSPYLIPLSSFS